MRLQDWHKDAASVVVTVVLLVIIGCYPFFVRHCDHCCKPTFYISSDTGQRVVAMESTLDRFIKNSTNVLVYHQWCFEEVYHGSK